MRGSIGAGDVARILRCTAKDEVGSPVGLYPLACTEGFLKHGYVCENEVWGWNGGANKSFCLRESQIKANNDLKEADVESDESGGCSIF